MDTGKVKEIYLVDEVMKTRELATVLKARIWDVFVKEKQPSPPESEAPPANPIDYAIAISQSTQHTLEGCQELLETEIISKLVGK